MLIKVPARRTDTKISKRRTKHQKEDHLFPHHLSSRVVVVVWLCWFSSRLYMALGQPPREQTPRRLRQPRPALVAQTIWKLGCSTARPSATVANQNPVFRSKIKRLKGGVRPLGSMVQVFFLMFFDFFIFLSSTSDFFWPQLLHDCLQHVL